jgi:hypothetical protein
MQCSTVFNGAEWLSYGHGAAWLVSCASACCKAGPSSISAPARHHREVFLLSLQAMRIWREAPANELYECDRMNVCKNIEYVKNKQKEWPPATKPV